jgi:hypothetical protein
MTDDNSVLTLLRTTAGDDAPALTLQLDDVLRPARRRRLRNRALCAGAGVAVAAGIFAALAVHDDEGAGPGPVDRVNEGQTSYDAHMMPALLKDVVLTEFGVPTPRWNTFDIESWGDVEGLDPDTPLPESEWDQAYAWELRGTTDDRAVELSLSAGDFGGTEGDPDEYCRDELAVGALECSADELADGRIIVSKWTRESAAGAWFGTGGDDEKWFVQGVKVYAAGTGYEVWARQAVRAPSWSLAQSEAWLSDQAMIRIASDPTVNLEKVLRYPDTDEQSTVKETVSQSP